jgi:hypothetical protein
MTATGFGEPPSSGGIRLAARAPGRPELYDTLVVRARAREPATTAFELGLVQADGAAFGGEVPMVQDWRDIRVPLKDLRPLWSTRAPRPNLAGLREISLVFGAWLYGAERAKPHGFEVERIWLEQRGRCYLTPVFDAAAPIRLISGSEPFRSEGQPGTRQTVVRGKEGAAWRVAVPDFEAPPRCVSWRVELGEKLRPWGDRLAGSRALRLRVRAGEPGTSAVEVVLLEADGAPWGCNVPLTGSWQEVTVPCDRFRYFSHWQAPAERGRPGDRLQPVRLEAINFCFGAWLFPERAAERHAVEIEGVWLQ